MDLAVLFITTSLSLGLPSDLLSAVCWQESKHDLEAYNPTDGDGTPSLGVCQIKLSTAEWLGFEGSEEDLMIPAVNVYYAGKYLQYQLTRYKGNFTKAVIAYNKGHANGSKGNGYSKKVLARYRFIQKSKRGSINTRRGSKNSRHGA